MKHTLGPWLCAPNTPGIKPTTRGVIAPRSENMLLATVYNPAGRIKEREANARLIATAPELLEIARASLSYLEDDSKSPRRRQACLEGARAAIAKATGETT